MLAKHGFWVADWGQTLNRGEESAFASKCEVRCHPPWRESVPATVGLWAGIGATHRGAGVGPWLW